MFTNKHLLGFTSSKREPVTSTDELPDLTAMTPEQEADWWDEHDVADELWEEGPEVDAAADAALGVPDPAGKRARD